MFTGDRKADEALQARLMERLELDPVPRPQPVFEEKGEGEGEEGAKMEARDSMASSAPSNSALVSVMVSRLTRVEAENKVLKEALEKKDSEVYVLKRKLKELGGEGSASYNLSALQSENARLRAHIAEIDAFLADYGMIWVGGGSDSDDSDGDDNEESGKEEVDAEEGEGEEEDENDDGGAAFPYSLDLIEARIKRLNVLAGEGTSHAVVERDGRGGGPGGEGRLRKQKAVTLTLYRNGLIVSCGDGGVGDGQFRSYRAGKGRAFMEDILDGFFPSELQSKYPDGVPFELQARVGERYTPAFSGTGRRTDGSSVDAPDEERGPPVSVGDFLARIPNAVIRSGNVISVKADVAALLGTTPGSPSATDGVIVVPTHVVRAIEEHAGDAESGSESERPSTPKNVTTLRVKSSKHPTLLLKLVPSDTLGTVFDAIAEYFDLARDAYQLRTTFPPRQLDDPTQTLSDAALVPSATLHLRVVTPH